jgi:thiosulfate dehydrogenase (quinone) large subunit
VKNVANASRTTRALPLGMPPRAWLLAGWALLPVRVYLGFMFIFAGLQKLMNPAFLSFTAPGGLHHQMLGYILGGSPISGLLRQLVPHSTPLGILFALGELGVGIGMALGLWTRIAAIGGMVLSLSLFLAVSFNDSPWYIGADITVFFMFTPFLIAGAGGVLSVDELIARRVASEQGVTSQGMVAIPFVEVTKICGFYDKGRCSAVPHRHCAPSGCPYLDGVRELPTDGKNGEYVERRQVVLGGIAAAAAAAVGLAAAGAVAIGGRSVGGTASAADTTTTALSGNTGSTGNSGSSGATEIGPAADVPVGQSATFTVPGTSDPGLVIQEAKGEFVAYNAVCPHAGCTVAYQANNNIIQCPCHGSQFQVSTGDVIVGPAERGLTVVPISVKDGQLYVT